MSRRPLLAAALLAGIALNTMAGAARIAGFHHLHAGDTALAAGDLDSAFAHINAAHRWESGDAPTCVLVGRVIHHAQANGLPLEALEGHPPLDTFGVGVAAVIRGIVLNPADAWAWFSLVDVYEGFRTARVRYDAMRRAGEAAAGGAASPRVAPAPPGAAGEPRPAGLDPEDRLSVAAIQQAIELEPEYFFYRDYLAKLYWARGLLPEAAKEIRESMRQWPRLDIHPSLEEDQFVRTFSGAILEGIEASTGNPFVGREVATRARALLLEKLERYDEAIASWTALRGIGDRSMLGDCDLNIGRLELLRGRFRESLPILARVEEEDADPGHAAWALYYMGQAHSRLGEHEVAASLYRRHLEVIPDSLGGYLALAEEEEARGRSNEAERIYISAVLRFPSEPLTYERVIDQMRRHGKAKQAISYAEALRKISPDPDAIAALIDQLEVEAGR